MITLDFTRMKTVPSGAHRGGLSGTPNYIGGRLDGQLAHAGWQPFRRSSSGQPLPDDQQPPQEHYVLFVVDNRYLWHYIHVSLLPADYLPATRRVMNSAPLSPPDRYVEGALVHGSSAWLLSRILASPGVEVVLRNPPGWVDRGALAATVEAIHQAAKFFDAASAAHERETATVLGAVALESKPEWTVRRAAGYLQISERRTQELAAELGGRKIGRQWLLEETAVRQEHKRRRQRAA